MYKIFEIAAQKALETTYLNITGKPLNPSIKFYPMPVL